MLFKLSNLNSNLALTLGYLNPALSNSALHFTRIIGWGMFSYDNTSQQSPVSWREGRCRGALGQQQIKGSFSSIQIKILQTDLHTFC